MKKATTFLCVVVMSLSPLVRIAHAGEIQPTPLSTSESCSLATAEADCSQQLADIVAAGNEGDGVVVAAAVLILILLLAAAASAPTAS
jgi:hypothetical protein